MNKKSLAILLSKLEKPKKFDPYFEQYQTDSELASEITWIAYLNGDIEKKIIADFGCGNGIFGIATLLLGAKRVYFLDADINMINLTKKNLSIFKSLSTKSQLLNKTVNQFNTKVNTVIQNPPFGVQKRKADKEFLLKAFETSRKIYSLHKLESKNFISSIASENNFRINQVIELNYTIKKSMKFHKKSRHTVKVGLWILEKLK